ncbi:MAG: hypothetical protein BJ554DRAFT_5397, partial [Olpidium bornovanus]
NPPQPHRDHPLPRTPPWPPAARPLRRKRFPVRFENALAPSRNDAKAHSRARRRSQGHPHTALPKRHRLRPAADPVAAGKGGGRGGGRALRDGVPDLTASRAFLGGWRQREKQQRGSGVAGGRRGRRPPSTSGAAAVVVGRRRRPGPPAAGGRRSRAADDDAPPGAAQRREGQASQEAPRRAGEAGGGGGCSVVACRAGEGSRAEVKIKNLCGRERAEEPFFSYWRGRAGENSNRKVEISEPGSHATPPAPVWPSHSDLLPPTPFRQK